MHILNLIVHSGTTLRKTAAEYNTHTLISHHGLFNSNDTSFAAVVNSGGCQESLAGSVRSSCLSIHLFSVSGRSVGANLTNLQAV
jgi:hypothetical protein